MVCLDLLQRFNSHYQASRHTRTPLTHARARARTHAPTPTHTHTHVHTNTHPHARSLVPARTLNSDFLFLFSFLIKTCDIKKVPKPFCARGCAAVGRRCTAARIRGRLRCNARAPAHLCLLVVEQEGNLRPSGVHRCSVAVSHCAARWCVKQTLTTSASTPDCTPARTRSSFSFLLLISLSLSLSPFPSLPLPFRPPISLHLPSFVLYMQNTCLTTLHLSSSAAKLRPLIPLLIHLPHLAGQEFCKLFTSILERQLADAKDSEQNIMHQYVVTLMTYPLRFFLFCYFEDTDRVHPPPPPMTGCRNYHHHCSSPFGSNLPHLC